MQLKHLKPNILVHMPYAPYVCQVAGASIIGGSAPSWITVRHYYYNGGRRRQARRRQARRRRPAVGTKRGKGKTFSLYVKNLDKK